MVALDKGVRDASSDSEKELDEFSVEMSMRKDVFDNIVAFSETEEAKSLEGEYKRFVEKSIVNGKRNGLHLSEEKRDEIKKLKKRISELGIDFNKNLNEDTTHLFFDEKELAGIPEDLLNSFERDG
jgi:Zn-dependent oligopeptidase